MKYSTVGIDTSSYTLERLIADLGWLLPPDVSDVFWVIRLWTGLAGMPALRPGAVEEIDAVGAGLAVVLAIEQ